MAASDAGPEDEGGLGLSGEVELAQRLAAALEPVLFFLLRRLRLRRFRLLFFLGQPRRWRGERSAEQSRRRGSDQGRSGKLPPGEFLWLAHGCPLRRRDA